MLYVIRATEQEKTRMELICKINDEWNHAGRAAIDQSWHRVIKRPGGYIISVSHFEEIDGKLNGFEYSGSFVRCPKCKTIVDIYGGEEVICHCEYKVAERDN